MGTAMIRFVLALAFGLGVPVAFAAPVPKAVKKKDDGTAILGRWQGIVLPKAASNTVYTFRFADDGTCGLTTGSNDTESAARYTLDPTASPKRMTWNNGPEWRCVYELDGDTLRIGFVSGKEIPDNMELKNGLTVYELKRVTDDK
jgi:uncharacterized protein (TIGR03067 family)